MTRFAVAQMFQSTGALESNNELVYSDDEDDDDMEEPAHPLGFASTRYCLDFVSPPRTTDYYRQIRFLDEDEQDTVWFETDYSRKPQEFPPLSNYIDSNVATTSVLMDISQNNRRGPHSFHFGSNEDDAALGIPPLDPMHKLTMLLQAASVVDYERTQEHHNKLKRLTETVSGGRQSSQQKFQQQNPYDHDMRRIQQEMELERRKFDREQEEAARALKQLLQKIENDAEKVREEQRQKQEQIRQADQEKQRREEEAEKARIAKQLQELEAAEEEKRKEQALLDEAAAEERRKAEQEAQKYEYVSRAKKLMAQLEQLRESVAPFEQLKEVAKRRLGMKKIVNGKVNTLADNEAKIREVAVDVSQAIAVARNEDDVIKQRIQSGDNSIPQHAARGKRYLVDLLASKVIVRVQAEGFNGPRGDGFPLANMLALVSVDCSELGPILAAHIYTVCPTAIPTLPSPAPDASEEELMKSLGMLQGKDGSYETFERFLSRTEGLISLVADIMSSMPENHTLLGGHKGAIQWLSRFLDLLPDAPQKPLPLLTAPVLVAFLSGAGHMLANIHPEAFKSHLDKITTDIITRLDDSAIGKPSSIRLEKVVEGGFDGFKSKLPSKALSGLYLGATKTENATASATPNPFATASPFGGGATVSGAAPFGGAAVPSPFGGAAAPSPSPFGGAAAPSPSPFGGAAAPSPSPFGGGGAAAPSPSPFGGGAFSTSPSPFGGTAAPSPAPFGGGAAAPAFRPAPSPSTATFGVTVAPGPSHFAGSTVAGPFAGSSATGPTPFGGSQGTSPFGGVTSPSSSTFGASASAAGGFGISSPSPFGGPAAPSPSPFGGPAAPSPSPFGGPAAPSPSPFGGPAAPSPSPFGGPAAPTPSPFGGPAAPNPSPFGVAAAQSPFGIHAAPSPSPFGVSAAPGSSPFGAAAPFGGSTAPSPSPFGGMAGSSPFGGGTAPIPAPFGASGSSTFGSSATANPTQTPFGGQASNLSPFGAPAVPSPFGGTTPFGNSSAQSTQQNAFSTSTKKPCKFFAEGRCRYGDQCRFSHDVGTSQPSSFSNPFGGPRR